MKRCPYCAEEIQDAAIVCRYCNHDLAVLPPPPLAQAPPSLAPTEAIPGSSASVSASPNPSEVSPTSGVNARHAYGLASRGYLILGAVLLGAGFLATFVSTEGFLLGWLLLTAGLATFFTGWWPLRWVVAFVLAIFLITPGLSAQRRREEREKAAAAETARRAEEERARAAAQLHAETTRRLVATFPQRRPALESELSSLEHAVRTKDWPTAEKAAESISASLVPLSTTELADDARVRELQARLARQQQAIDLHRQDERTLQFKRQAQEQIRRAQAQVDEDRGALMSILAEYKNNEVAADSRYKGRVVQLRGRVGDIKKEILGRPYVTLGTGGDFEIPVVQCVFNVGKGEDTATVSRGQELTVRGKVDGLMMNVLLSDCELVQR